MASEIVPAVRRVASSSSCSTLGGDRPPEIVRPSVRGFASEQATPVDEPKIYVAVGKDVKENKSKIFWTVHQSGGNFKICVVHVLVPSRRIPMGGLGAGLPASLANEIVLRQHRENERINVHKILDSCLLICKHMGVRAEKECIESDSVEKGIVELIGLRGIRKLVMGAAADKRYFKKMIEIRSEKAIFIRDKAHISCHIWFICDGHLIHTREARTVQAPLPTTPSPGARKSSLSKSQSATLNRSAMRKLSNPFQDIMRRSFSRDSDPHSVLSIAFSSSDSSSEQPNAASIMLERQDSFQGLKPVLTSLSHHPQLMQSVYHAVQSSISNAQGMNENDAREELEEGEATCAEAEVDIIKGGPKDPGKSLYAEKLKEELEKEKYLQSLYAEKLKEELEKEKYLQSLYADKDQLDQMKEELEKEKDQLDQMMEKLRIAPALKSRLENQFEETDLSRKELELKITEDDEMLRTFRQERELLQIELENARQKAEEVSRRSKGDSLGTRWRGCPRRLQVTNFPSGNLTILDLSWSKVTKDWEGWDQIEMQNLRVLDLTGCADLLVTPKFCGCKNLAILILERCSQLVKIDHSIGDLKCLVSLNLKFCTELSMLPGELGHLTALQELLMDGTLVQEIPIAIGHLKQLETLSASNCCSLSQLPRTICHLTNISRISLDSTRITALPDSVGELVRLEHLSLRDCRRIRKLPNSIGNIGRSLVELDVSGTGVFKFPDSMKDLQNLKVLRMDSCFFREFPPDVGELTGLEEIHASWCRSLEGGIPSEIGKLHNLRVLRLRHSSISSIPAEIHQLSNLRTLDLLHCNMIKELPTLPSGITILYIDDELKSSHLPPLVKLYCCDEDFAVQNLEE